MILLVHFSDRHGRKNSIKVKQEIAEDDEEQSIRDKNPRNRSKLKSQDPQIFYQ